MDKTKWQVPTYNILLWTEKVNDSCIVIPIINEGPVIK